MVSRVIPVQAFDLVVFGGTGDLAKRKILPSLFRRFVAGQMPNDAFVIGVARSELDTKSYQDLVVSALKEFEPELVISAELEIFIKQIKYVQIDAQGDFGWSDLADKVRKNAIQAFYFSVSPSLFGQLAEKLHQYSIASQSSRIVLEKPFGRDLNSAQALNAAPFNFWSRCGEP